MGLGHGFSWVVLNASAWRALPEGGLRGLLRYVATEEVGDDKLAADLAAAVEAANEDAAWREEALTMLTIEEDMRAQARFMMEEAREEGLAKGLAEGRAEGRAAGRIEGADKLGALVVQLIDAGRLEDARRAATDARDAGWASTAGFTPASTQKERVLREHEHAWPSTPRICPCSCSTRPIRPLLPLLLPDRLLLSAVGEPSFPSRFLGPSFLDLPAQLLR